MATINDSKLDSFCVSFCDRAACLSDVDEVAAAGVLTALLEDFDLAMASVVNPGPRKI
jgi:hypothetical protein